MNVYEMNVHGQILRLGKRDVLLKKEVILKKKVLTVLILNQEQMLNPEEILHLMKCPEELIRQIKKMNQLMRI